MKQQIDVADILDKRVENYVAHGNQLIAMQTLAVQKRYSPDSAAL